MSISLAHLLPRGADVIQQVRRHQRFLPSLFRSEVSSQANPLSQTDAGLARVLEDLIDVLINRGLIQFTDLPAAAQAKLLERRQTRASLVNRLELLPDDGDSFPL